MSKGQTRDKIHEIIYEADTPMGKLFDVVLLILILISIIFVMLESVAGLDKWIYEWLYYGEWFITIFFTIEYILRIISIRKPSKYIFSFYGIIDLLSTLPLYLSFILAGSTYLLTVRALRLLRVFRILKIARFIGESNKLVKAIKDSTPKILVFLFSVLVMCIISGTLMYLIEGEASGFKSIPVSVYWCIVTLTTVGFGDIAPVTPLGQLLAAIIMILGYGIIAVPTGIVSAEYVNKDNHSNKGDIKITKEERDALVHINTQVCRHCNATKHQDNAKYCHKCGFILNEE